MISLSMVLFALEPLNQVIVPTSNLTHLWKKGRESLGRPCRKPCTDVQLTFKTSENEELVWIEPDVLVRADVFIMCSYIA
jgi:hypothetical protein